MTGTICHMVAGSSRHQAAPHAPTLYECPECGWLSPHQDFRDARGGPCGGCAAHGASEPVRTIPHDRGLRLDERIRAYHREGEHEIVVILVAAYLEAMLEDVLDRILTARGADLDVRRVVMNGQRGITDRLVRVFPRLTHAEFDDAAGQLGFRDFPNRWRRLRDARNAFIHESPFRGIEEPIDRRSADEALALLDEGYRLFAGINNRYAAGHRAADS